MSTIRIFFTFNDNEEWITEIIKDKGGYQYSRSESGNIAYDKAVVLAKHHNISVKSIKWLHAREANGEIIGI